ncbi:MAG: 3-isopropylmalate dehydratase small subunit [Abitibacteriaceae bacterium]|nr:3-isopropylmalate dehydratase small subunit [Abditibacteriaceae bacterium]MBV9868368.1 3-isopropylmalate dehydratase small subunit [Abditibacteriaceae bacterium]
MQPFVTLTGVAAPLDRANVDTDQIIPKQFLKRIERTGFGQFLFYDWRYEADGVTPNPDFELNAPAYEGATILVAGRNFGSGSSREHAPWALADYGFRCIITPSYADIFFNNCFQNGILPIILPEETVKQLIQKAQEQPGYELTIDLPAQTIRDEEGLSIHFDIDPFRKNRLVHGLDDIGTTLQHEAEITAFEQQRPKWSSRVQMPA